MTEAQTILNLIETVDPEDRSKLRELAIPLEQWLDRSMPDWRDRMPEHCYKLQPAGYPLAYILFFSRDALKAIRPEGWKIQISQSKDGWYVKLCREIFITTPYGHNRLPTGESAELHAIIQTIEYEQNNP